MLGADPKRIPHRQALLHIAMLVIPMAVLTRLSVSGDLYGRVWWPGSVRDTSGLDTADEDEQAATESSRCSDPTLPECATHKSLFPGVHVKLNGLKTHSEFNGRTGVLLGREGDRFFVKLDGRPALQLDGRPADPSRGPLKQVGKTVKVRPINVVAMPDPAWAVDAGGQGAQPAADVAWRSASAVKEAARSARRNETAQNRMRQGEVRKAFVHSWRAYERWAWSADDLRPVSKQGMNWLGLGGTIVDSLDTLMLMGLRSEYSRALEWVRSSLTFHIDSEVPLLEVTIRVLGGLLSAFEMSDPSGRGRRGDRVLLQKAVDLGDRLIHALRSPSGIAWGNINLVTGHARNLDISGQSVLAEVGSIQLEFNTLSRHTGNRSYSDAAMKLYDSIRGTELHGGLFGLRIDTNSGKPTTASVSLGGLGDSFYEYLLKVFLQTGDQRARELYERAVKAAMAELVRTSGRSGLVYLSDLQDGHITDKMEHLTCFAGGMLALGSTLVTNDAAQMRLGKDLTNTCYQMYRRMPSGLAPEDVTFRGGDLEIGHGINLLRPETVESLFYLWRLTKDRSYREWGWQIFKAFEAHCRLEDGGYSGLLSVDKPTKNPLDDRMHSFWMAETLKYLYLLFGPDDVLPFDEYVFNTEAHPLRRWYRNPKIEKPRSRARDLGTEHEREAVGPGT